DRRADPRGGARLPRHRVEPLPVRPAAGCDALDHDRVAGVRGHGRDRRDRGGVRRVQQRVGLPDLELLAAVPTADHVRRAHHGVAHRRVDHGPRHPAGASAAAVAARERPSAEGKEVMRRLVAVAATALLGLAVAACGGDSGGAEGADESTVNVGVVQLPIFAPLLVADANGYLADGGLTVNIENVKSGQDAIPLAASGKLDAVLAGFSAGMFSAIESGLDVRVVGSMGVADADTENPASALVVAKPLVDSGEFSSIADL